MSQVVWNTIDPFNTNGEELVTILTAFKDAVISGMKGPTRPTEIDPGGMWVDDSEEAGPDYLWKLTMWTGVVDVVLFVINIDSGTIAPAGGVPITTTPDSIYGTDGSGDPALYTLAFLRNEIDAAVAALDIDWDIADILHKDISANETYTFSNVANGKRIRIVLKNTAITNVTITFPMGIVYEEGFSAVIKASTTKVFTFIRSNGITVGLSGGGGSGTGATIVANNAARDAIASGDRYDGLMVYSIAAITTYRLGAGLTNSDWTVVDGSNRVLKVAAASKIYATNGASAEVTLDYNAATGASTVPIRTADGSIRGTTLPNSSGSASADDLITRSHFDARRKRLTGVTVANGGTIGGMTTPGDYEIHLKATSGVAILNAATPFTLTNLVAGNRITLVCTDDTLQVGWTTASGPIKGFDRILGNFQNQTFLYDGTNLIMMNY